MQPSRTIIRELRRLASPESYLYALADLMPLVPDLTKAALKVLLHRLVRSGELERVCRGIYLYPFVDYPSHLLLYHVVSILRPKHINYLSLESVLSETGIISQAPFSWIGIISTGRSATLSCGKFGTIEFIHTKRALESYADELAYDKERRLWIASPALAKADLQRSRSASLDLIQEG
ncbi:MAG: type IV toxin-antitoxin system AbiEi family antitoxin domain-containing protein [Pseudodesulfovibrio sp.]|nr:type IV toxin-antitoxin system AbiEi family antitoxin domain-containing protein [Pseudodesulfovibrio sp.]